MAIVSRMNGGKEPFDLPWGLDAFILASPYFILWPVLGYWTLLGYAIAILGLRTGHGSFFHYGREFEPDRTPEKVEFLIPDGLSTRAKKIIGMALTGLMVTIGFSIILMAHGYIISGVVIALSGAAKSIAYLTDKTEASEYIRGAFLGIGLVLAYLIL